MRKLGQWLFIICFCLILLYPLFGKVVDEGIKLSGVSASKNVQELNYTNIMEGTFQTSLNDWVDGNFPGRKMLIKIRSQAMYSLLNDSPNKNVQIGKDKYLYEPNYIRKELAISVASDAKYYEKLITKLETLQELMAEQGKELYIFITPNKAHFFKDKLPETFLSLERDRKNDYERFAELLKSSKLHYFDSRVFLENYDGPQPNAPLFYATGIHWSSSWGMSAAKALTEYISETGKWNLSTLKLTETTVDAPKHPDTDLYKSLNLLETPTGIQFYTASLSIVEEGDKPNVFFRGGSFMGQSLNGLIRSGMFGKDVHYENNYYFKDIYTSTKNLSSFTAYNEAEELPQLVAQSDIFVLEVNEEKVTNMSFGFIDLLLEHPEWLVYPEEEG